jgi:hypothetical protein
MSFFDYEWETTRNMNKRKLFSHAGLEQTAAEGGLNFCLVAIGKTPGTDQQQILRK